jgi:HSP20 family protein
MQSVKAALSSGWQPPLSGQQLRDGDGFTIDPIDAMLLDAFSSAFAHPSAPRPRLAVDILELASAIVIKCDAAGVRKEDLHVSTDANHIYIHNDAPAEADEGDARVWRRERATGATARTIRVNPSKYDMARLSAVFKDGLLTVSVPRAAADAPRRQIAL